MAWVITGQSKDGMEPTYEFIITAPGDENTIPEEYTKPGSVAMCPQAGGVVAFMVDMNGVWQSI